MTTYKGINGFAVQSVATDPSPLNEGQVWYNNATYAFKLATLGSASWASSPSLNTSRRGNAGTGTVSSTLTFGGWAPGVTGATEKYNGTSWTSSGTMNTARAFLAGAGTQTASLGFGGYTPPSTYRSENESFNGTTWTNETSMPVGQLQIKGTGTQTAAITVSASVPPGVANPSANFPTIFWNGTSWASGGILNTLRANPGTGGPSTAALAFGGSPSASPGGSATEAYNGTSWTSLPANMNTARADCGHGNTGNQTNAICMGGVTTTAVANTETYNGTTWTSTTNLPAVRFECGGAGNGSSAFIFGGEGPPGTIVGTAFTYSEAAVTTKTITTS